MNAIYDAGAVFGGSDWLSLHKNENHFVPREYLRSRFDSGEAIENFARYPDSQAIELRSRLARQYGVDSKNIYIGNGSDGVVADVLTALHPLHDTVHLPDVGYKVYDILARRYPFRVSRYDARSEHVTPGAGVWLIDSPNAITGRLFSSELIHRLSEHPDAVVVWDNCYGDFEQPSLDIGKLERCFVVRSFSKYYGLAGLRIGYCISTASMVSALEQIKEVYNVNAVAQHFAAMALEAATDYRRFADAMIEVRSVLKESLTQRGFKVLDPHGNFLLVSHSTQPAQAIRLGLEGHKVAVRYFDYPETRNWLRITVPARADLVRLLAAIDAVI